MSKICSIMQPTYFPWLGYFDLIDRADTFVFYDDVQIVKQSWGIRNRIKSANGPVYLSVPIVKEKHHTERTFINSKLDYNQDWVKKHLDTIRLSYKKAPYFNEVFPLIEDKMQTKPETLGILNISIIRMLVEYLGLSTEFVFSSELKNITGKKESRLIQICNKLNADFYLSPQGSSQYIEHNQPGGQFSDSEVDLYYQNFEHPVYPQLWGEFVSHLSIIDVLMNCGKEETLKLLRSGQKPNYHFTTFRKKQLGLTD